jgi:hypothetical protein
MQFELLVTTGVMTWQPKVRKKKRNGKTDLAREAPLHVNAHKASNLFLKPDRLRVHTLPDLTFKNSVLCSHSELMDFCNADTEWQRHMCAVNVRYDSLPPEVQTTKGPRHGHNVCLCRAQFCFARDF